MAERRTESRVEKSHFSDVLPEKEIAYDGGCGRFHKVADEDGDARFEPEIRHHVGHAGVAGCSELPGGSSGEFSHYDLRGHKAAEEIADEETDDSFFH